MARSQVIDDIPLLDVTAGTRFAPAVALDETTDPDHDNINNEGLDVLAAGEIGISNGDADDTTTHTQDGTNPIGSVQIPSIGGGVGLLFNVNSSVGADGPGILTQTVSLLLNNSAATGVGVKSSLKATQPASGGNPDSNTGDAIAFTPYADNSIWLFLEPGGLVITGRVGNNDPAGPIAFQVSLASSDPSSNLVIQQILAIEHPLTPDKYDEGVDLNLFSNETIPVSVKLSATLADSDGDEATNSHTLPVNINFADDGPRIAPGTAEGAPVILIDESLGLDVNDPNAEDDDVPGDDVGNDLGVLNQKIVSTSGLFGSVDYGTDGKGNLAYELILKDGTNTVITDNTTLVLSNLFVVDVAGAYLNPQISLVHNGPDIIFGVVTSDPDVEVFRVAILPNGDIIVDQFLPISHGIDGSSVADHDDPASLGVAIGAQGFGGIFAALTATDGDGDKVTVVNPGKLFITFEDDGINVDVQSPDAGVIEGATINGTYAIQPGVDGLATGQLQIIANAALVATVSAASLADGEVVNTSIGQFTFSALDANGNGTWSLASADVSGGDVTVSLQLSATDGDGDTDFDAHIFVIDDVDIPFSQVADLHRHGRGRASQLDQGRGPRRRQRYAGGGSRHAGRSDPDRHRRQRRSRHADLRRQPADRL